MESKLLEKLAFLSRLSKIDNNIATDFDQIIKFVNKIVDYKVEILNYQNKKIFSKDLREDIEKKFVENKNIILNFSNEEDEFCIVPITVEKEYIKDGENKDE